MAMAKQYDDPHKKWYCAKCREDQQNDRKLLPDKRPAPKLATPKQVVKSKPVIKEKSRAPKSLPRENSLERKKRQSLHIEELKKRISLDSAELKKRISLENAELLKRQPLEHARNDRSSNEEHRTKEEYHRPKEENRRKASLGNLEHHYSPPEKRPKPDKYVERLSERTSEKLSERFLDKRLSPEPLGKNKNRPLMRSHSIEDNGEGRLKKLIKHKQAEMTHKLSNASNESRPKDRRSPPSMERSSSLDSAQEKVDLVREQAKEAPKEQTKPKKKSFSNEDPSLGDLFKPVMMQKKVPTIKRLNSTENALPPTHCLMTDCRRPVQRLNDKESIYCSKECIERYVTAQIPMVRKTKLSNVLSSAERKSISEDDRKVTLVDKKTGKYLSGNSAIEESRILSFVLSNPTYEIQLPMRKQSTNAEQVTPVSGLKNAKASGVASNNSTPTSGKEPTAEARKSKAESSEDPRETVRSQLRRALNARLENCQDSTFEPGNVKHIATRIERKLFELFKEPNKPYKNRFRSLLFNLKDPKNEGLFKKVLSGKLDADRLVRMSSEELASPELAKWRERENRHSIEMIKKDAEAQATQIVVKKTHKGEEVIKQTAAQIPVFEEIKKVEAASKEETKGSAVAKSTQPSSTGNSAAKIVSAKEMPGSNPLDLLFKDTTEEHGQHLFDLHCKICSNQTREDLSLVNRPKPLSEFEKNRLKEAEELEKRAAAELNNIDKLLSADSSNSSSSNADVRQLPNSAGDSNVTSAPPRTIHSCWNGYLCMQDMSKFIAFAYKVSGIFETQVSA